jgi:hypothetical protein
MILAIWRQKEGRLERIVAHSHLTRKHIVDSLMDGDYLEFEAGGDLEFEHMERAWWARITPSWI